jgi:hypothetical protein
MTLEEGRSAECRLLEVISGSRAYGLATPESDTDIKGVFVQPQSAFYGLVRETQINHPGNDIVFYELGRFVELLAKGNPNLLEMLFTPADCVIFRDPLMDRLDPALFLSRQCFQSFAHYAMTQIRKARGLNKKIVNPMPEQRKGVLDFCHVLKGQGSVALRVWLDGQGLDQARVGLAAVPHMPDVYGVYPDPGGALGYRGILQSEEATELRVSSIARDAVPAAWMSFNRNAFKKHCQDWQEYWEWVGERNEARYRQTEAHGQGYDAKNLMHTFRLLTLAEEIARDGRLTLRVADPSFLLSIKRGEFTYDWLLAEAERRLALIEALYDTSPLPSAPDLGRIEKTLVSIRRDFWDRPSG